MITISWQIIFLWEISIPIASLLMNIKLDVCKCTQCFEDILG